ncbi:MAG: hypothetical protein AB7G87_12760 [Clostridia bacterium]
MWFDEIMDDCKKGLEVANENKGIFIPILINAGFYILFFAAALLFLVIFFIAHGRNLENVFNDPENFMNIFLPLIIGGLGAYLLFIILRSVIEAGSINLYKFAAEGIRPKACYFFDGAKRYFFKIFAGTIFFHMILLVLLIPLLLLLILYTLTVGVLTGGWGLILVGVIGGIYLSAWTVAVVVDDIGPLKAIGMSIKLGRKYFRGLFVLTLSGIMISNYLSVAFGPLVVFIGGWFISGVVLAFFKLVLLLVYKRKKEEVF